jgi:hypothetical protein
MFGTVPYCVFALLFSLAGCTTEWATEGSYYRTTQTLLDVQSTPPGKISINGSHKGESSSSIPWSMNEKFSAKHERSAIGSHNQDWRWGLLF